MEKITVNTETKLYSAVKEFVATKRFLNTLDCECTGVYNWAKSLSPKYFDDRATPGYATMPAETLKAVLPFFKFGKRMESRDGQTPVYAQVPVKLMIGSGWEWDEHIGPKDYEGQDEALIAHFTAEANVTGGNHADVTLIKPLGLFYSSGEGKNRVGYLARHGVEWMPCRLFEEEYPAAHRLEIVDVFEGSIRTWLCILDSKFVVTIPYPEFTLPILKEFGVKVRTQWQFEKPMLATVMNSFRQQNNCEDYMDKGMRSSVGYPLDLDLLLKNEEEKRTPAVEKTAPLIFSKQIKFSWPLLGKIGGALLISCCFAYWLWPLHKDVSFLLFGVTTLFTGAIGILCMPVVVMPEEKMIGMLAADPCLNNLLPD